VPLLSQREQSEPIDPGHGLQSPSTLWCSQSSHWSCVDGGLGGEGGRQRGPSHVGVIGMSAQDEPAGVVPWSTKVLAIGWRVP
jgi:hypothetical protein